MDLKATLNGYFEKTPIPTELAPNKIAGFIQPRAVIKKTVATNNAPDEKRAAPETKREVSAAPVPDIKPMQQIEDSSAPVITASTFIKIVRHHRLTGSEFLSLIGNTKISNKAYQEIESNPGLTVKRLIEILEESSLTPADYEKLTIAVQRTAQLKEEARAKLEAAKLAAAPAAPKPAPAPKPKEPPAAEPTHAPMPEIMIEPAPAPAANEGEIPSVPELEEIQASEEQPEQDAAQEGDGQEEKPAPKLLSQTYQSDMFLDLSEDMTDDDDFESGSNKGKFIAAAVAAVILIAISFGLRYYFTGSLLPSVESESKGETAVRQSLDENGIFEVLSALAPQSAPAFAENKSYTAGGFAEDSALVRSVSVGNRLIYYSGNTLYIFEKIGGQLEQLDARKYDDNVQILGLLQLDSGVAVVTAFEGRAYSFSYSVTGENGADDTYSSTVQRPETVIEMLDSEKPENRNGIRIFGFSGNLSDIWTEGDRIIAVTWESIAEGAAAQDFSSFMPCIYTLSSDGSEYRALCSGENVFVPENPQYGSFVSVFSFNAATSEYTISAVSGGSGQLVSKSGSDLFIGQGSLLVRYDLSSGVTENGVCTVSGIFGEFSAVGVYGDEIRVTTLDNGSAALTVLDSQLGTLSEVKNLGNGEAPFATCYNGNETYLITESGTLYGVDGSNQAMTESSAGVTNAEIYKWSDSVGIKLDPLGDADKRTGLSVSAVSADGSLSVISTLEISSDTVAENALNEYISSPAETDGSTLGASPEDGILVIPVSYFDGVSEVERFVICNVTSEGVLSFGSSICEYDRQSSLMFATADGGTVTVVMDDRLITAKSDDGSIIGYFNSKSPTEVYSYDD